MTPSTHLLPLTSCRVAQFDLPSFTGLLAKLVNREQTKIRSGPQFCLVLSMCEPLKRPRHYRQRAAECEKLAIGVRGRKCVSTAAPLRDVTSFWPRRKKTWPGAWPI